MSILNRDGGLYTSFHEIKKGKYVKKYTVYEACLKPKTIDKEFQHLNYAPPDLLDIFYRQLPK
jgi:hypothetical protein